MNAETEVGGSGHWRAAALALVAVLALLAAFAATAARAADYVSLGDSYAAGPLIPNQSLNPLGCLRSSNNYSHLAAPSIGLALKDPSCSGAKTNHMTEQQNVEPGPNPPQFNSLSAATTVVSITIGGNDIGFSEVAQSCITINPFSTPCKDKYAPGGKDQLAERIAATAPKVDAVLDGIRARSPLAKIYVVNYPAIFPETGIGCWPQMPIGFGDVSYLRSDREKSQRDAGQPGRGQRRDPGRLVQSEHWPRRLQIDLEPLGRTAGAGHARGAHSSQQSRDAGRRQRAGSSPVK